VFSGGGGPAYVTHPTFGYLLGFPVAAWLIGMLFRAPRPSTLKMGLKYIAGTGIIHGMGLLYLLAYFRWIAPKAIAIPQLIWAGSLIFLPGEILKIGAAIFLHQRLVRYLGRV
jgi:biotin transport system substrate-specific component